MSKLSWLPLSLVVLALAGCTLEPKYKRPPAALSPAWPQVPGYPQSQTRPASTPAADIGWRQFFQDARLQRLIELALTNNPDLRVAVLNVEQSRALYRVQRNALIPTVDVNANSTRQRIPNVFAGGGGHLPMANTAWAWASRRMNWTCSAACAA